jgi:two-component system cell cycle sensor histidine kinase/response regulator CckA
MDQPTPGDTPPEAESPSPGALKRQRRSETVLAVDDDPWVLRVTVDFLAGEEGYHVLQATGGEEALRIAETHPGPIHVLLTDVVMPRVNGWMLAKRLRLIRPETKVLFMTAYSSELVSDHRTALGDPVIMKPCDLGELAYKIREVLGRSSPFARRRGAPARWPSPSP